MLRVYVLRAYRKVKLKAQFLKFLPEFAKLADADALPPVCL